MGRLVTETGITRAVVTSRIGEQTYFPEIVRMDILSAGYITVPGDINCINLSADRVVGKWDGNTLDSYQVNIEGIDIKSTGISKDLFLKTTGDGRVVWDPTPFADTVGNVDGSGTANTLAKFTDSDTIGDSIVTDNGSVVTVGGDLSASGTVTADTIVATTLLSATNLDITYELSGFSVTGDISASGDMSAYNGYFDGRVGIGTADPEANLEICSNLNQQHLYIQGANSGTTPLASIKTIAGGSVLQLETGTTSDSRDILKAKNSSGTVLNLQADGKLGIGIETPTAKLAVQGSISASGGLSARELNVPDNGKITLGNSDDLQLFHSGSQSYMRDKGTGGLYLQTNGPAIYLQDTDGNDLAQFSDNGGSFLMYNHALKLGTTNTGIDVTGTITSDGHTTAGDISASGGLSAYNGYFADNVGIGTNAPSKSLDIHSGTGDDGIRLYSTGSGGRAVAELQIDSVSNGNADFRLYCATNITTRITTNAGNPTYFNAGNVGIGTSTPGEKLTVSGNISACGGLSAHNGYFADNVGIGTNTPTKELEVTGTIFGTTQVCSPAVCGSTSVCGALISDGSSCLDGSGNVCGSYGCFSTQVCGAVVTDGSSCLDGSGNVCGSYGWFSTQVCGACVTDGYSCFDGGGNVCGCYGCFGTQVCGAVVTDGYACLNGSSGICSNGDICATSNTVCAYNGRFDSGTVCGYYGCFSYVYKSSSTFHIDHPLESKKDTHSLVHSVIEGPKADNIYSGVVQLTAGSATINIDNCANMTEGTFVALNRCIRTFANNESNWDLVRSRVSGNIVTVESCVSDSTADVSWMVIGERQDVAMTNPGNPMTDSGGHIIVEPEKPALSGDE